MLGRTFCIDLDKIFRYNEIGETSTTTNFVANNETT